MGQRHRLTATRRQVLAGASSLAVLSGLGRAIASAADPPRCLIDVHCHIFNARDVPAGDFVLNVVAREHDAGGLAAALGAFLVALLSGRAPSVGEEQRKIGSARNLAAVALNEDQFHAQVSDAIEQLNAKAAVAPPAVVLASPTARTLLESGNEAEELVVPVDGQALNPEARALLELKRNYGFSEAPGPSTAAPMTPSELSEAMPESGAMLSPASQQSLADAVVADVAAIRRGAPSTPAGRLIAMARVFLSYRIENIRTLDETIRRSADAPSVRLYCPALVDFDSWLGVRPENASTALREQAGLLSQISLRTDAKLLVNGYMAFDPLRAAMGRLAPLGAPDPLFLVRKAVEDLGFIGVKLYPPMGFRPWGNAGARQVYGKFVNGWLKDHYISVDRFEAKLDEVLGELYDWCLNEDVPIMAHCGNSQAAFKESGLRANPDFWDKLLQSRSANGKPRANLRLNLAHSGAVWCHIDPKMEKPADSKESDEHARCRAAMGWSDKLFGMLANPAYPNLCADLADVAALVIDDSGLEEGKQDGLRKTGKVLRGLVNHTPRPDLVLPKLLYGTDWMFLAMFPDFDRFADGGADLANLIQSTPDAFMWRNAARFLGLVKPGPNGRDSATVTRLRRFYRARSDKLKSLDALLV